MVSQKRILFLAQFLFAFSMFFLVTKHAYAQEQTYNVASGETLWSISEKFYGSGFNWPTIANKNNIIDPPSLSTGATLIIPSSSSGALQPTQQQSTVNPTQTPTPPIRGSQPINQKEEQPQAQMQSKTKPTVSLEDAVYADLAIQHYLNNISVYVLDGKPENLISINSDRQWLPASTVKTFVAMYAYDQINKGKLNTDDLVLIDAKNVVSTELVTDELPVLQVGDYVSVGRLIRQMVTQSDNTAYNVLLDVLDRRNVTFYIHSLGLIHSSIGSKLNLDDSQAQFEIGASGYGINTTTAQDYAEAFDLINQNKIPGAQDLFYVLTQQKINNMIPLFLPKSITVAHKTGELAPLYHDGGIIKSQNRTYVLAVLTNTGDPKIVAHISNLIYSQDLNLIGAQEATPTIGAIPLDQPLDPFVFNWHGTTQVLGSTTPLPGITAADLGITANDLSQVINPRSLPHVFIPADSRLHFIVNAFQAIRKGISLNPQARTQADLDELALKIAEAKELRGRGKIAEANVLLRNVQSQMVSIAKTVNVANDPLAQTTIQSLSDTRFSLLNDELKKANQQERTQLIKEIATQARNMVTQVQPLIPQASSTVNPAQHPIIGKVINSNDLTIKVRTAGGEEITISNQQVRVGEKGKTTSTTSLSTIKEGTTIALMGTRKNNAFVPTFVLKNLPKELAAPQPVIVLKVDSKKKVLVVSENGVAVQVNLTQQATIRGSDTDISITSVKPGDTVVVYGEKVNNNLSPTTPSPVIFHPQQADNSNTNPGSGQSTSPGRGGSSPSQGGSSGGSDQGRPSSGSSSQPTVIQSSSVQVIQHNQGTPNNTLSSSKNDEHKDTKDKKNK